MGLRIERLKLVNFIGIFVGMGKTEIEINFNKNYKGDPIKPSKFVLLFGANGSGKTTILSQLHPFKDSFDSRKSLIIDGEEGIKEIDYDKDGVKYTIQHYYRKSSTDSYIQKDGVELNPNGGVRTFIDIVRRELEITPDYFKIGRIGSNVKTFADQTTSERKKYIANIAPSIDIYLEAFENVKKKYTYYNNQLKSIVHELQSLGDELHVKDLTSSTEQQLKDKKEELRKIENDIVINKEKEKNILENYNINEIDEIEKQIAENGSLIEKFISAVSVFKSEYPNASSKTEDIQNTIHALEKEIVKIDSEIKNEKRMIDELKKQELDKINEIIRLKSKLSRFEDTEPLQKIEARLQEIKEKINKNKAILNENPQFSSIIDVNDLFNSSQNATRNIEKLERFFSYLKGSYAFLTREFDGKRIIDYNVNYLSDKLHDITNMIKRLEDENAELNKLYASKLKEYKQLKILDKRPKDCKIDTCPFIVDALKYVGVEREIDEIEKKQNENNKKINDLINKRDKYEDLLYGLNEYNAHLRELTNSGEVYRIFLKEVCDGDLTNYIKRVSENQLNIELDEFKYKLNDYITALHTVETSIQRKEMLETNIKNIENSEKIKKEIINDIEKIEKDKVDIQNKINKENSLLEDLKQRLDKSKKKLNDYQKALEAKIKYKDTKDKLETLKEKYNTLLNKKEEIKIIRNNLIKLENEKQKLEEEISILDNKFIAYKTKLNNIQNYKKKQKELTENFEKIKILRTALDPNKGIPLYFINLYLQKIQDSANELLSIAYNDTLSIGFEVTSKDFFIKVNQNGSIKEDISIASQGEESLIKISLCLAMIEQSMEEYNILVLDEIDGPLDSKNRYKFVDILESQMDKLGVSQAFIISHNDAFDKTKADLILLNGYDTNTRSIIDENKNILFMADFNN